MFGCWVLAWLANEEFLQCSVEGLEVSVGSFDGLAEDGGAGVDIGDTGFAVVYRRAKEDDSEMDWADLNVSILGGELYAILNRPKSAVSVLEAAWAGHGGLFD